MMNVTETETKNSISTNIITKTRTDSRTKKTTKPAVILAVCCSVLSLHATASNSDADSDQSEVKSDNLLRAESSLWQNFSYSGKLMADVQGFDGFYNNQKVGYEQMLRRARLKLGYQITDNTEAKIQWSYDQLSSEFEVKDWYVKYSFSNNTSLQLGKVKEPIGLESATSSSYLAVAERSMATKAFSSKRNEGVLFTTSNKHYFWQLGWFENASDDAPDLTALSTRFVGNTKVSISKGLKLRLHAGVSYSDRELSPESPIRINESLELYNADSFIESNRIDADQHQIKNIEFAADIGRFNWQSEWYTQSVSAIELSNDSDSEYDGHYHQASIVLFGEGLKYNKHRFGKINGPSDLGALQLVAKYSELNARDNDKGSTANALTLGANYYYKNYKVMMQYVMAELSDKNSEVVGTDGNSVTVRLQYLF